MRRIAIALVVLLAGCADDAEPYGLDGSTDPWGVILAARLQAVSPYGEGTIAFEVPVAVGNVTLRQVNDPEFEWIGRVSVKLVAPLGSAGTLIDAIGGGGRLGSDALVGQACVGCSVTLPAKHGSWQIQYKVDGALVMPYEVLLTPS